jgi:hypothetical protein
VSDGLGRGQEAGAHADGRGTGFERSRNAARGGDSAGGDDRNGSIGHDGRKHGIERRLAADVTAGLCTLRDDVIAPCADRGRGLVGRADLPPGELCSLVDYRHERGIGIAVEELDDGRPFDRDAKRVTIEEWHQEVHAVRSGRRAGQFVEKFRQAPDRDPGGADHAEAARGAHGARKSEVCSRRSHPGELQREQAADEIGECGAAHRADAYHARSVP